MITTIDDYNIRAHNTFRMNVNAKRWIEYTDANDLPAVFIEVGDLPFRAIGEGSNMLFLGDYDGALLHSSILEVETSMAPDGGIDLHIGSGVVLDGLIETLAAANIFGLENLSLIPGTAGSAAVQNVGAYGVEIKDFVTSVECYDRIDSRFVTLHRDDCQFAYRDSFFKRPESRQRYIVTYLNLHIPKDQGPRLDYGHLRSCISSEHPTAMEIREAVIAMRRQKLPDVDSFGSAGSFFKNPVVDAEMFGMLKEKSGEAIPHFVTEQGGIKIPAAWLIDQCGLKSCSRGGAMVWEKQPLVIVNRTGHATSDDIVSLENHIIDSVKTRFGITLHPEVDHIK